MFNFKKILFLVLCLALILTFASCGNDENSELSSSTESKSQTESAIESESNIESESSEESSFESVTESESESSTESAIESETETESESNTETETETQKPENTVTVKFDTQGSTQIKDAFVEKGENIPKPSDPEKEHYIFDGWYIDGEKWSFVGHVVTKDITLTAKWAPVEYTITFIGATSPDIKYTIEDDVTLPYGEVGDFYMFDGWFEDEELTKPISKIEKGTHGDKTLYAKTTYSGICLTLKGNAFSVSSCDFNATEIVIPSTYNGKSVTSIGDNAFYYRKKLTSITIPDSITEIGIDAFVDCDSLSSVTIGNGVTSIGDRAFYGCSSLTSVTIGDSVTSIGVNAFYGCPIESATIPTTAISSILKEKLKTVVISSGASIDLYAFDGCSSLTSVTIGDSVTLIGANAFRNCSSLTSVTIGDSAKWISSSAFEGCPIQNATIPTAAISDIPKEKLETVVINGGASIDYTAFDGCSSIKSITIGDSVTSIGSYAFRDCYMLESVTIGDSVTSIDSYAFEGCAKLTSIIIPSKVTEMGRDVFDDCTLLAIYCEATSKPNGWDSNWNYYGSSVYWFSENAPTTNGNYWHYGTNGEIVIWN